MMSLAIPRKRCRKGMQSGMFWCVRDSIERSICCSIGCKRRISIAVNEKFVDNNVACSVSLNGNIIACRHQKHRSKRLKKNIQIDIIIKLHASLCMQFITRKWFIAIFIFCQDGERRQKPHSCYRKTVASCIACIHLPRKQEGVFFNLRIIT